MIHRVQNIPGLSGFTSTQTLIEGLRTQPQRPLEFWLDGEVLISPG